MIFGSLVKIAFGALMANKLRSSLTLLGVFVGVTSVMTIISALEGFMGAVETQLYRLGPSSFVVATVGGVVTSHDKYLEMLKRKKLEVDDISYIEDNCYNCEKICPRAFATAKMKYRNNNLNNIMVMGCTYNFLDIVDFEVGEGRFHAPADDFHKRNVIFIGNDIKENLFDGLDPIGKYMRVNNSKYEVIGVATKQGSMVGRSMDNFAVIPLSSHTKLFGKRGRFTSNIIIKASSVATINDAIDETRMALRSYRNVPYNKKDDFEILTPEAIIEQFNKITGMFRLTLVGISSISLVVGGIVVMNIMMVSVTERTREIGIRKALGARQKHILLQFLIESLISTTTGGLLGILAGYLIAGEIMQLIDMDIAPSMFAIFSGIGVSTGIGLFFGIYPAMKAARMSPVKALSHET